MTARSAARAPELDYHLGRVLLLVASFTDSAGDGIDGLTKLAKLDFLLRYPGMLGRVLRQMELVWAEGTEPSRDEELAVESAMIRYKYGPWDDRYYPIAGALIGMGLVEVRSGRGRIALRVTDSGRRIAGDLAATPEWATVASRTHLLAEVFAQYAGSRLKELIYRLLPDAVDRPHRAMIEASRRPDANRSPS